MVAEIRLLHDAAAANTTTTSYLGPDPHRIVPSKEKRQSALERIRNKLCDLLTPEEQETLLAHIEQAEAPPSGSQAELRLAAALSGGYSPSASQKAADETAALIAYFRRRHALLEGALTAKGVADVLGTTRQTPHDRLRRGTLLAIMDRGIWRFPRWQFDPEGPDGVVPGLPQVLRALTYVSPLGKASWLTRPNPFLEGMAPLEALKQGLIERVVAEARGVGTH